MIDLRKAKRVAEHIKCARSALKMAELYPSWGMQLYSINGGPHMNKRQLLQRIETNKKKLRELLNEAM